LSRGKRQAFVAKVQVMSCCHRRSRQAVGERAAFGQDLVEFVRAEGGGERGEQGHLGAGPALFGWPGGLLVAEGLAQLVLRRRSADQFGGRGRAAAEVGDETNDVGGGPGREKRRRAAAAKAP
jgi:hypothetical protein